MSVLRFLNLQAGRPRPGFTTVRRRPAFDLSLTGLVYATLMMFMGVAAVNTQASLLFAVFGLMIGILLVSVSVSRMTLKRVRVVRHLPEAGTVGEPLTVTYHFENAKVFWPTVSLTLAELDGVEGFTRQPTAYLLHASAGASVDVPVGLLPKRRGVYTLRRVQVSTSFPFGFIKRAAERSPVEPPADAPAGRRARRRAAVRHAADTLVIYPACGRVDPRLLALCMPAETTGSTLRPRRGGSDEPYGLKEFQQGESRRLIHWKRSARTGVLVTREMTQVSPPRLLLLVDTQRAGDGRADYAAVEEAIAMAASVADHALGQGLSVGAFAWTGGPDAGGWGGLAPTRGKRQRRDVMTLLARLPANADHPAAELTARCGDLLEPGTTAVLLTSRPAAGVGPLDRTGAAIVSVVTGSPQAKAWFRFPPPAAFDQCLPADQEAGVVP